MQPVDDRRAPEDFPAPGWYRDALNVGQERYWNGEAWLMETPDSFGWNEIEQVEVARDLTARELRGRQPGEQPLYGADVAPPLETQHVVRLGLWIMVLLLMVALPFQGPVGIMLAGAVGLVASIASFYDRSRAQRPVAYVPLIGGIAALMFMTGLILTVIGAAVHAPVANPDDILGSAAPGLGTHAPTPAPTPRGQQAQ